MRCLPPGEHQCRVGWVLKGWPGLKKSLEDQREHHRQEEQSTSAEALAEMVCSNLRSPSSLAEVQRVLPARVRGIEEGTWGQVRALTPQPFSLLLCLLCQFPQGHFISVCPLTSLDFTPSCAMTAVSSKSTSGLIVMLPSYLHLGIQSTFQTQYL